VLADDRVAFEAAIRATPEDQAPRLIYADWLDENGFEAEADRHREWAARLPAAAAWLREETSGFTTCDNYADEYYAEQEGREPLPELYRKFTFEEVVQAGHDLLDRGYYLTQMGSESMCGHFSGDKARLYWYHWEAYAARRPVFPDDIVRWYGEDPPVPFSCSC
jgi:uncharacterized protein (TIGR02996 family)